MMNSWTWSAGRSIARGERKTSGKASMRFLRSARRSSKAPDFGLRIFVAAANAKDFRDRISEDGDVDTACGADATQLRFAEGILHQSSEGNSHSAAAHRGQDFAACACSRRAFRRVLRQSLAVVVS